jgi:hypothetical protein
MILSIQTVELFYHRACDNFDRFQHLNFRFSQKNVSLLKVLFIDTNQFLKNLAKGKRKEKKKKLVFAKIVEK